MVGDLGLGEHPGCFEPVAQAGDVAGSADRGQGLHGVRLTPSGEDVPFVQDGDGLIEGVLGHKLL